MRIAGTEDVGFYMSCPCHNIRLFAGGFGDVFVHFFVFGFLSLPFSLSMSFHLPTCLCFGLWTYLLTQTFACDDMKELGERFLRADYSLKCGTSQHRFFKIYSGVMILVSPG